MKKVYCKNCKWYQIGFWYEECWRFANFYEKEAGGKIYQEFVGKLELDIEQNKDNECPNYKKKHWWKFWVEKYPLTQ